MVAAPQACAFCGAQEHALIADYHAPPAGETDFAIAAYRRTLWQCRRCGHCVNAYGFDLSAALYKGGYADATYGDRMRAAFVCVMSLSPERSDNRQRVAALNALLPRGRVLDVGSGLGVFPAAMAEMGWTVSALDPDPRAAALIAELAPVESIAADFLEWTAEPRWDLVTFNKVLEHVGDPVGMLTKAAGCLSPRGKVYVELPDGEAALRESPDREEFFVEHLDAYSPASFAILARRAGFSLDRLERLREASGKYTLRGLMSPWA